MRDTTCTFEYATTENMRKYAKRRDVFAYSPMTGERYSAKDWPEHLSNEAAASHARSAHQEVPHIM